jgi:hypothetical protein
MLAQTPMEAGAAEGAPVASRSRDPVVERWPLALAIGGGVSASGRPTGEVTFLPDLPGPYLSLGYSNTRDARRLYGEVGVCLILNLAAGVGPHLGSTAGSQWGFHLFAGLPIPLVGFGPKGASAPFSSYIAPILLFVEPFYRPEFRKGVPAEHEVGLLLKVRIGLTKRQWSLPGFDFMAGVHDL